MVKTIEVEASSKSEADIKTRESFEKLPWIDLTRQGDVITEVFDEDYLPF